MRSPPGSVMMSFALPDPAGTFRPGGLDVWAVRVAPPSGNPTSAPTNARRPTPTLPIRDLLRRFAQRRFRLASCRVDLRLALPARAFSWLCLSAVGDLHAAD